MQIEAIFGGDNLRYIHELRGVPLAPFFYNKPLILMIEFFALLGRITIPLIVIFFLKWSKK